MRKKGKRKMKEVEKGLIKLIKEKKETTRYISENRDNINFENILSLLIQNNISHTDKFHKKCMKEIMNVMKIKVEKEMSEKGNTNDILKNIVRMVEVPDYLYMAGGMKVIDIKEVVKNIKKTNRESLIEKAYGLKFKLIEKLVNENIIPCTMINTIMESVNKNKLNFSL